LNTSHGSGGAAASARGESLASHTSASEPVLVAGDTPGTGRLRGRLGRAVGERQGDPVEEDLADQLTWAASALPEGEHIMPWRIEDELRELGANYIQAGAFRSFAIRDGNLVTGQQNFSGAETARMIIEAVGR
jgi:putative intracellular protease/amidase